MLKLTNIRLPVGVEEQDLARLSARRLRVRPEDITSLRILRKSLDIRDKRRLEHVYTLGVGVPDERKLEHRLPAGASILGEAAFEVPVPGQQPLDERPVVVGAGPAGQFAAYLLAKHGYAPIVLERGQPVRQRVRDVRAFDLGGPLDPESNYLFGEGGAGTFSDGKLTCRSTGPDTDEVLRIIADCKRRPEVVYEAKPHLGSNQLPAVVKALRRRIIDFGGDIRFQCRVDDLAVQGGQVRGVVTNTGPIAASVVILASGHSARDTYRMLMDRGVPIITKPFQMGVRIEQPQEQATLAQYGSSPQARLLGPADYTLKVTVGERELFTFCMCAGGYVMPSVSSEGYFCTNGMSRSYHESPFANSGLVVTVDPATVEHNTDPLVGVHYQEAIERRAYEMTGRNYHAPIQRARDFLRETATTDAPPSSYQRGVRAANLWELLPADIARLLQDGLPIMDRQWNGEFLRNATLVGPESRGSCPVRILRDRQSREAPGFAGLYPIGEGAGYAGGIVSAAVDGLRTAKAIIARYQPIR